MVQILIGGERKKKEDVISVLQQAFVDDHTLVNASPKGAQYNLDKLQFVLDWTKCLVLKPPKCRSLSMGDTRWKLGEEKGKSYGPFDPKLKLKGEIIKCLGSEGAEFFKFLGRCIWPDLNTKHAFKMVEDQFVNDMEKVNSTKLKGAAKVWIYQFMVLSRLTWPFLVYPFSITSIEKLESIATSFIKKWYNVNRPLNPSILYLPNTDDICGWNVKSPVVLFKSMQITNQHILKNATDPLTRQITNICRAKAHSIKNNTWQPSVCLDELEEKLDFKTKFGGQTGTTGLGFKRGESSLKHASIKERRQAAVELCKKEEAENRMRELHVLARAGDFLSWDNLTNTQADWNCQLNEMSPDELSFTLNAQALTLPDPSNLVRWGFNKNAICQLCGKKAASAKHILSSCIIALNQHRYTWRHDNVIRAILPDLKGAIARANRSKQPKHVWPVISKSFIKAGTSSTCIPKRKKTPSCRLDSANDWSLTVDLDNTFLWPIKDFPTIERPDIVIVSLSTKNIIWGELTVPQEKRCLISQAIKAARYSKLKAQLMLRDWRVHDFTWEIGTLGFTAQTVTKFFSALTSDKTQVRFMRTRCTAAARRSSFYIWTARHIINWAPPKLFPSHAPIKTQHQQKHQLQQPQQKQNEISTIRKSLIDTSPHKIPPIEEDSNGSASHEISPNDQDFFSEVSNEDIVFFEKKKVEEKNMENIREPSIVVDSANPTLSARDDLSKDDVSIIEKNYVSPTPRLKDFDFSHMKRKNTLAGAFELISAEISMLTEAVKKNSSSALPERSPWKNL